MSGKKNISNEFKPGSLVVVETFTVNTLSHIVGIGLVDEADDVDVWITHAMMSIEGGEWKKVSSKYEGEYTKDCRLITPEEFDLVLDVGIIPRDKIKNVKLK